MKRAICQHHGQKFSENPDIKSSRDLIRFSSRDIHTSYKNLVEIYHNIIKSSRDSQQLSYLSYCSRLLNLVETCDIIISSSRDVCICTSSWHTSRYVLSYVHTLRDTHIIMYKRTYTVTLDIEFWDDLKLDTIDWAKRINLFPDEYIHSSVKEHHVPRPVDSIWGVTIES